MHSIRLRGPWECFLPGEAEPRRIEMPATGQRLADLIPAGTPLPCPVRLLRHFGLPTGIEPSDRLEIVVESAGVPLDVTLNGQPLGQLSPTNQPSRLDVTSQLSLRNELSLAFPLSPSTPLPIGEVRLEITND